jgi:hypothetical protein
MSGADQLAFVVAGVPPSAVAVGAEHVRRIAPEHGFSGEQLVDLRDFGAPSAASDEAHVLVIGGRSQEIGVLVAGRVRFLVVHKNDVLALPASIEEPTRMSHVIAQNGVPEIPVVALAKLESLLAARLIEVGRREPET